MNFQTQTKDSLIKEMDEHLFNWAIGDIEQASIKGNAKLAGFILCVCFLDAVAGFYAGVNKEEVKHGSGIRFKNFVNKYLKQYGSEKLYIDLRCGLVHSYAEGGTYVFTDGNKDGKHFDRTPRGKILLNLEDFFEDVKKAYCSYRDDIMKDKSLYDKAKRRYFSLKLMMPKKFQDS